MKYKNIFWLGHKPNTFQQLESIAKLMDPTQSISKLMEGITFAYDFKEGSAIVQNTNFDLCVLTANFPDEVDESYKDQWNSYLNNIREGKSILEPRFNVPKTFNNFTRFIHLNKKPNDKVVVFSGTAHAISAAFEIGIPFYSKKPGREKLSEIVDSTSKYLKTPIENYEYGDINDFVQRYLI